VLKEEPAAVTARVFPQPNCRNGELARSIYETAARDGWKVEELHTEEGRLDEVFRSITMPDTVREEQK
jgi:ABC-2 type transport system ATP-binding protein